jgi:hypothetical protein
MASYEQVRRRGRWSLVFAVLAAAAILVGIAGAAVWTDRPDYSPGSTVTISGDNRDGAGYLGGETVHVDVSGPNDWTATCDGQAADDESAAWSCQVTLADNDDAIGDYEYTATGLDSGVTESGTFTDASSFNVRAMVGATPIAVTFPGTVAGPGSFRRYGGTPLSNNCGVTGSTTFSWRTTDITTPTNGTFSNVTGGIATINGQSIKAVAPATVGAYTFLNWTVVNSAGGSTGLNGSIVAGSVTGTEACFAGWVDTAPTYVQANYVLAQGTLNVTKTLANDTGKTGNKTADDFQFDVSGPTASSNVAFESDGSNALTVNAGSYTVTEDAENGYTPSYSNCTSVSVAAGGSATCAITNTFNGYGTTTATQVGSTSFTIGNTVGDTATVTGDADAEADPSGNVDFYLCGPTDPTLAYVACATGGTKVKDNASLTGDGNAGTYTATASYTVTAAQLTQAGKYCMRAEYEGDSLYKDSKDNGLTNECFTVNPASATVVYTGLFDGVEGTPTTLSATVTSSYEACAKNRAVTFDLDGALSDTSASATTGSTTTGSYTGTASTTKTLAADAYDVTASVDDKDLGSDGIPECSADDSDEAILMVAQAGSDAHGGGWYKVTGASPPRVNFGFAVKKQKDGSFKGQLLWMNNEHWKLKGTITGYGKFTCPTSDGLVCGVATGTGTLYEWDSGTGTWVNPQTVGFAAKFWDGGQTSCAKKNCTKQERPDWFGMEIAAVAIAPESSPQQLMGGSIHAGT